MSPAFPRSRLPSMRLGAVLVGLACLVGVGLMARHARRQPPSEPWKPRLVILVSIDTCRADHLGCYGYKRPTSPNLDRLAAEGTLFEKAFSQSNESLFSYGSIMTGHYPREVSALSHAAFRVPESTVTLGQILSSYGVDAAAYVAGGHLNHRFGTGRGFATWWDRWDFGSFYRTVPAALRFLDRFANPEPSDLAANTAGNGTGTRSRPPAFLFVQGYDAHDPYQKPGPFHNLYDPGYAGLADEIASLPNALERVYRDRWYPRYPGRELSKRVLSTPDVFDRLALLEPLYAGGLPGSTLTLADADHLVATYDSSISYADVWLGLLVARIRELGLEEQTLLVVIGDHGEELGERGYHGHRMFLDDISLHVPLVVWGPGGVPRGRRIPNVVELRELKATVLDYLGLSAGTPSAGLRPLIEGRARSSASWDCAVSEGLSPQLTIRTADWRLTYLSTPPRGSALFGEVMRAPLDATHFAVYDVRKDPLETRNLIEADEGRRAAGSLRTLLLLRLRQPASPAASPPARALPGASSVPGGTR